MLLCLQAQAQREAFRHQTSRKLLQASADGPGAAKGAAADGLKSGDYADLAALAGRLAAQQEGIEQLSGQLNTANVKRAELAKVGRPWLLVGGNHM
jgi:hypothetical protein